MRLFFNPDVSNELGLYKYDPDSKTSKANETVKIQYFIQFNRFVMDNGTLIGDYRSYPMQLI